MVRTRSVLSALAIFVALPVFAGDNVGFPRPDSLLRELVREFNKSNQRAAMGYLVSKEEYSQLQAQRPDLADLPYARVRAEFQAAVRQHCENSNVFPENGSLILDGQVESSPQMVILSNVSYNYKKRSTVSTAVYRYNIRFEYLVKTASGWKIGRYIFWKDKAETARQAALAWLRDELDATLKIAGVTAVGISRGKESFKKDGPWCIEITVLDDEHVEGLPSEVEALGVTLPVRVQVLSAKKDRACSDG